MTKSFPFIQEEYNLLSELSPLANPSVMASTFTTLLSPLLTLFGETMSSLIALVKRSLHKYTFLALASYESLLTLQPLWDNLLARRGTEVARRDKEGNELKDGLLSLRAVCLRSFPECLVDVKLAATSKGGEFGTGLADITSSVCLFFVIACAMGTLHTNMFFHL
jgi:exocyst complex protein 7